MKMRCSRIEKRPDGEVAAAGLPPRTYRVGGDQPGQGQQYGGQGRYFVHNPVNNHIGGDAAQLCEHVDWCQTDEPERAAGSEVSYPLLHHRNRR